MYTLLTDTTHIQRDEDGAYIPVEPLNRDYRDYLAWVAAGNTATPALALVTIVPEEIDRRQFFQELAHESIISNAEALAAVKTGTLPAVMQTPLDAMTDAGLQFKAEMLLAGALSFMRSNPMTPVIGAILGKTSAQLDTIWTNAAQL